MHALSNPMNRGELALAFISGGLGFAIADFADRYFATYSPAAASAAGGVTPTDRFTGGTNGTLANTLNIASPPSLMRIGIGIGITAVPAIGAYLVKNNMGRAALHGMMLGAGIKLFSTLWNAYVMGNLLKPADATQATMQASLGARTYPAETVAKQNLAVGQSGTPPVYPMQGLNAPPQQRGLPPAQQQRFAPQPQRQYAPRQGMGDVGPFAVAQQVMSSAPCPGGTVADSLTGACSSPCWDGSTPAGGQCPPQSMPGPQMPNPGTPWGGPPQGECSNGCGLSDKQGPLPTFLGFMGRDD